MAEMFWDRARYDPDAPPIFAAPPPPPLPLAALPPGHPWWMPPLLVPQTDAAAGRVAPASLPLPALANVYPWGNAPLIFSPVKADAAGQPAAAPSSLPGALAPNTPQPASMPAQATSRNDGPGAAAIAPQAVTGSAPAPASGDPVASASQLSSPGNAVTRRQHDWSDADRARFAGAMQDDFHRRLLSKYPDLPPRPYSPSFGELKPAQFTPTQQVGYAAADGLMALGVQPYLANELTHGVGNLLSVLPPIGIPGAAADTLYAQAHHDSLGALLGMVAMLPGIGPVARAAEGEIRSAVNAVRERVAGAVHDIGSALKAEAPATAPGINSRSAAGGLDPAVKNAADAQRADKIRASQAGKLTANGFIRDYPIKLPGYTRNLFAWYQSEGEARALARQKLGSNPVEVEANKWRSANGKWQYRANPDDVELNHVHIEELDPSTGEVLQNWHLRWPEGTER